MKNVGVPTWNGSCLIPANCVTFTSSVVLTIGCLCGKIPWSRPGHPGRCCQPMSFEDGVTGERTAERHWRPTATTTATQTTTTVTGELTTERHGGLADIHQSDPTGLPRFKSCKHAVSSVALRPSAVSGWMSACTRTNPVSAARICCGQARRLWDYFQKSSAYV